MASRAKKKQIKQKDFLAEQGLSSNRKKGLSLTAYIYIKIGLLIALPLVYFLYSPCTIFVIAGFIFSYILAFKAERTENQSVAKANRINIFKIDAALALIVVVVAVGGMISDSFSATSQSFMKDLISSDFDEDDDNYSEMQWRIFWRSVTQNTVTLGSLSTGNRSFLDYLGVTDGEFSFSKGERPEGGSGGGPPGGGGPPQNLSADDLPIEYLTETVLSMVNTILIACVFVGGIMSLALIYIKKNKMKKEEERGAVDFSNSSLTDEAIEKLISFGDVEEVFDEKYQQVRMLVGVSFEQIEQENQALGAKSEKEAKMTETANVAVEEVATETVETADAVEVETVEANAEVAEVETQDVDAEVVEVEAEVANTADADEKE